MKAAIFDWGGVLIENSAYDIISYAAAKSHTNRAEVARVVRENFMQRMHGQSDEEFDQILKRHDLHISSQIWSEAFAQNYRPIHSMIELGKKLKQNGMKVGLLSNTIQTAQNYYEQNPYGFVDYAVFSCDVGLVKPDPAIYERMLSKLEVLASETVFFDDKKINVEAAENLGMIGILVSTPERVYADARSIGLFE